jgi:hypothetical protein
VRYKKNAARDPAEFSGDTLIACGKRGAELLDFSGNRNCGKASAKEAAGFFKTFHSVYRFSPAVKGLSPAEGGGPCLGGSRRLAKQGSGAGGRGRKAAAYRKGAEMRPPPVSGLCA